MVKLSGTMHVAPLPGRGGRAHACDRPTVTAQCGWLPTCMRPAEVVARVTQAQCAGASAFHRHVRLVLRQVTDDGRESGCCNGHREGSRTGLVFYITPIF